MTCVPIPDILEIIARGDMIVLVDDPGRENEGDLVLAAEKVSAEGIAFMAKHGSGLICLALEGEILDRLEIPLAPRSSGHHKDTAFTLSIEAHRGVTTGISAMDRATTIRAAVAKEASPGDIVTPGHVFPLRARQGGVLQRAGHTEGSVDLTRMVGLRGAAVICEILNPDGTMARAADLEQFCLTHQLAMCSVADIVAYRQERENVVASGKSL
ncbi:MAG: 3,4-dihydroxy-2-butanone-4-phosphate synthase [Planctomycetota bacterium]|nr:3,4-dihydroxy-2-butanone-4-phosphate synthase [Planctomycetota bacterium]